MGDGDVEVRREDQLKINEFGRLNAKLHEKRADRDALQKTIEELDDATTELAMSDGEHVKLMLGGEAFIDVSEEYATEHCEAMQAKFQADMDRHTADIEAIEARQKVLKSALYGRFGSSINLEEK
mmetsp:Transcript_5094/g.15417  ORF Transcript_5094/g.15417 Transcript_5094/m.15417 type:complete len:125 (-) Transcript_5094:135-509(-)